MWFEPGHQVTTSWLNNNTENITGLQDCSSHEQDQRHSKFPANDEQ